MLPLRFRWLWFGAGLLALVAGLVVALGRPGTVPVPLLSDKLLHTSAFLVFMLWFGGIFRFIWSPVLALVLLGYGLLIEYLQSLTVFRYAEVADVVADGVGILLGWLLCAAGLRHWCSRVESWLVPRGAPPPPNR